ncbi:MAG: PIN domain-containing protein [Nitrospirae bacterium]|nr:PIN domain-containing protein [Nitrospirota bacterium]
MEKSYKIDTAVCDTGIIYALADKKDSWHKQTVDFVSSYKGRLIIPSTVIPEACYLLNTYLGSFAEIEFINSLINKELSIEHFSVVDLNCCIELLKKYEDFNIGFVDASIIAISERLNVCKIVTTDRKHFSVIKPKHCGAFSLLP